MGKQPTKLIEPTEKEIEDFAGKPPVNAKLAEAQTIVIGSHARLNEAQLFLNGLAELRMALGSPSVSEGDSGIGDRAKLQPMFDDIGLGQLRKRYMKLFDRYMMYTENFELNSFNKDGKKPDVGENN